MLRQVLICGWAVLLLGAAPGHAAAAPGRADTAQAIETIVRERAEAGARGDKKTWRRHVADDCIWMGAAGLKIATTAEVEDAQVDIGVKRSIQDFEAHVYGNAVVATYVLVETLTSNGKTGAARIRKLDTYVLRNSAWILVANAESAELPPRKVAAVDPNIYDRCAGEYAGEFDAKVSVQVWRDANKLMARDSTSPEPFELLPESENAFFIEGDAATWIFETDAKGRATALVYRSGPTDLRFKKVH